MEKRNSQLKHGQPMEQTRGLLCISDSGVARCQSFLAWASELGGCQSNLCNS